MMGLISNPEQPIGKSCYKNWQRRAALEVVSNGGMGVKGSGIGFNSWEMLFFLVWGGVQDPHLLEGKHLSKLEVHLPVEWCNQ